MNEFPLCTWWLKASTTKDTERHRHAETNFESALFVYGDRPVKDRCLGNGGRSGLA